MKPVFYFILAALFLSACSSPPEINVNPENWAQRRAEPSAADSLANGTTYLSIYSRIHSQTEHKTHELTATVSLRNPNLTDSVFIDRAQYYSTEGDLIRTYFDHPIYIAPMETVTIVIHEADTAGGAGANFLFDWQAKAGINEPIFDAVMITTYNTLGLSFATSGVRIK